MSAAPDAAFATVALTPTARSLGTTTAMRAERVGAAQARAEVVRIGDAVEDSSSGGSAGDVEHVVERDVRQRIVDDRDDTLVAAVSGQRVEARVVDEVHRDLRGLRARDEIAHPRVVRGRTARRARARPRAAGAGAR